MTLLNTLTGEALIEGSDHHLLFTAGAFVQAETMLGVSTPEIIQRVQGRLVGFRELQALVACGIDGYTSRPGNGPTGAKPVNPTKALRIVEKYGWLQTLTAVAEAVTFSTALGILSADERKDPDAEPADDEDEAGRLDPGTGPV